MAKTRSIAEQIRAAIAKAERSGTTQGAIAAKAGIPRSQIGRIASGENLPRLDTAEKIVKALGYHWQLVPN